MNSKRLGLLLVLFAAAAPLQCQNHASPAVENSVVAFPEDKYGGCTDVIGNPVRFTNGIAEKEEEGIYYTLRITHVGALAGATANGGNTELIVASVSCTGGFSGIETGFLVLMRDREMFTASYTSPIGDRAHGGLYDISVAGNRIAVTRFGLADISGPSCCPDHCTLESFIWQAGRIVPAGDKRVIPFNEGDYSCAD